MTFVLVLFVVLCCLRINMVWGSSYSHEGEWKLSSSPEHDCKEHYLCAPGDVTWKSSDPNLVRFDVKNTCDKLIEKGITRIDFRGDSYMRQIYAAILITMNGNYVNGSIANTKFAMDSGAKECTYHKQFSEKHCGVRSLNHNPRVCDGKVELDPMLTGLDDVNKCTEKKGSIVLFSWGNYKVGNGKPRHGVNNATAYSQFFEESGLCPSVRKEITSLSSTNSNSNSSSSSNCRVFWISTHFRLNAHHVDEEESYIQAYNTGMRDFFESQKCGDVGYVDVYNMTQSLATGRTGLIGGPKEGPREGNRERERAEKMSYDQVHWGMEVNLVKAQIILNALIA